jgi:hypothetical protein
MTVYIPFSQSSGLIGSYCGLEVYESEKSMTAAIYFGFFCQNTYLAGAAVATNCPPGAANSQNMLRQLYTRNVFPDEKSPASC